MEIKMRTTSCGPEGNQHAGETVTVSDDIGKSLVTGGYAIEVKASGSPETAIARTRETATARQQGKRQ